MGRQHHSLAQYRDADHRSFERDPALAEQREEAALLVVGLGLSVRATAERTCLSKSSVGRAAQEFLAAAETPAAAVEYARALLAPGKAEAG